MERGVIGRAVRSSSGPWLGGGGDCAVCVTGELKLLRGPAVVVSAGTQLDGPSDAFFEAYGVLLRSRLSVNEGRGWATVVARVNRGAGAGGDRSAVIVKSEVPLGDIPLWDRWIMRGPAGFGGGREFIAGSYCRGGTL